MVGMAMRTPYFTKSRKENFTSYFRSNDENMMPAKAPIGVKKAPMLLPMIEAKIAWAKALPVKAEGSEEKRMLIGMLLMRFEAKKEA